MIRAILLSCILCIAPLAAQAAPPCFTQTPTVGSLRPHTPLERAYYDAAVCYRQRWLDSGSATKSATTSLEARDLPSPSSPTDPEPTDLEVLILVGLTALALGAGAGHFLWK